MRRGSLQSKWMAATSCLAALALGVAACGGDDNSGSSSSNSNSSSGGGGSEAKTVTVYSSLPLQGASRVQTEAVNNGAKLALEQSNNKAPGTNITVKYNPLDDS